MDKEQLTEVLGLIYEIMGSHAFANNIAQMYKNLLTAMTTQGFSREEAITIISRMQFGNSK